MSFTGLRKLEMSTVTGRPDDISAIYSRLWLAVAVCRQQVLDSYGH